VGLQPPCPHCRGAHRRLGGETPLVKGRPPRTLFLLYLQITRLVSTPKEKLTYFQNIPVKCFLKCFVVCFEKCVSGGSHI
jgi:hypothetical protein